MAAISFLLVLVSSAVISGDILGSDVSAWRTALETSQEEVVREQLVHVQQIALNAIPKAQQLRVSISDLTTSLIRSLILPIGINRELAQLGIQKFMQEASPLLADLSIDQGDKWFTERSGNTPVDGDTRFFFDLAFFSFSAAAKDLKLINSAVQLLRNKVSDPYAEVADVKQFAVIFFQNLGVRETDVSLTKAANGLNQFFTKWMSGA